MNKTKPRQKHHRPELVYLYIADKTEVFDEFAQRFVDTYVQFPACVDHDLIVVVCGKLKRSIPSHIFKDLPVTYQLYCGDGMDIGAHQASAFLSKASWSFYTSSQTYFKKPGWMEKMMSAIEKHGDGLYGSMASYDMIGLPDFRPHIRTCFYACKPETYRQYPHLINSREDSLRFEHGDWSVSEWFEQQGKPVLMVTRDGIYPKPEWRKPDNIFRRGDQSNLLTYDRHTDAWASFEGPVKEMVSNYTDGWSDIHKKFMTP